MQLFMIIIISIIVLLLTVSEIWGRRNDPPSKFYIFIKRKLFRLLSVKDASSNLGFAAEVAVTCAVAVFYLILVYSLTANLLFSSVASAILALLELKRSRMPSKKPPTPKNLKDAQKQKNSP